MSDLNSRYEEVLDLPQGSKKVPNKQPQINLPDYRIAIIGEAPGTEELYSNEPFTGTSGRFLRGMLDKAGINYHACYVGNVSQSRPPGNDISYFDWDGDEIQDGLNVLDHDLTLYNPHLCLLLGNTALRAASGEKLSVDKWRGSLFSGRAKPFLGRKCLATYHPAGVLRNYDWAPILLFDLRRSRKEGGSRELNLPDRSLVIPEDRNTYLAYVLDRLNNILSANKPVAMDIEGGIDTMSCLSFATSPSDAFIIPFTDGGGQSYWTEDQEVLIWSALSRVLDSSVPKILQNCLYDNFVLTYSYASPIRNIVDDTMLKHWEAFSELEKSLGFQASIYTKEPYYKGDRKSNDLFTFWRYCCKDSALTHEINSVLDRELQTPESKVHYKFNLAMLNPLLYMELRGIRYDKSKAKQKLEKVQSEIYSLQHRLNREAGCETLDCADPNLFKRIASQVCKARRVDGEIEDLKEYVLAKYKPSIDRIVELLRLGARMDEANLGELSALSDLHLNVDSNKQMVDFLYRRRALPVQYKKEGGRNTEKPTTDVLALLNLFKKSNDPVIKTILRLRSLMAQVETLSATTDKDGRIRCGYNIVGAATGRLTCYESPTGSGYNLQTVTKKHRDLFLADDGHYLFQCDLAGADGWTVAAWCAALGDSTMLDDYNAGLKPAKIVALMYEKGTDVTRLDRLQLKEACKAVDQGGWLYFTCKRVQHGTNYGMKERTMADQILKDSYKLPPHEPVHVDPTVCARLQGLYLIRYRGIKLWHRRIEEQIKLKGYLVSASGHRRILFGRREDHDTFKSALSNEPQENTTYVTNLAAHNLWNDPTNRLPNGRLVIEPLHQVHDALLGQFPCDRVDWAKERIRAYFRNPVVIGGQTITIPFEGNYGRSWGELDQAI